MKIGILISGSGSNMIKLIESCQNSKNASINIVISNNPDAKGIDFAKSKNIKTKIINHKEFSQREDFDNQVNNILNLIWKIILTFSFPIYIGSTTMKTTSKGISIS